MIEEKRLKSRFKDNIGVLLLIVAIIYGVKLYQKKQDMIHIQGSISANAQYRIIATYRAENDLLVCRSWSLFGQERNIKSFWYSPTIKDGHHSIVIPTKEISLSFICNYKLSAVSMVLNPEKKPTLRNYAENVTAKLFRKNLSDSHDPRFYYRSINDTLNIECVSNSQVIKPCRQAPYLDKVMVTQYFSEDRNYTINVKFLTTADILDQEKRKEKKLEEYIGEKERSQQIRKMQKQMSTLHKICRE